MVGENMSDEKQTGTLDYPYGEFHTDGKTYKLRPRPRKVKVAEWSLGPTFEFRFLVTAEGYPGPIHRWLQRVCLGIYWRKLPEPQKVW